MRRSLALIRGFSVFALVVLLVQPVLGEEANSSQSAAAELLADPKYRFCNDADYRLFESQKSDFCSTAEESAAVCPGLLAACGRPAWDEKKTKKSDGWSMQWARWLAPLVQVLFWAALAMGLGFLLWNAWKVARSQAPDFSDETKPRVPSGVETPLEVHGLGLTREQLMQLAQQAASAERYKEALLHLYRATLQGLSDLGWVRLRESATCGDYSRLMRRRLNLDEPSSIGSTDDVERAISHLRALERERFAHQERPAETLDLLERTHALLRRFSGALVILLGFLSQGCGGNGSIELPDSPASPGGTLLFEELIGRHAESSQRRFRRVESVDDETTAVVVMAVDLSEPEWKVLSSWVGEGGALVVVDPPQGFAETFETKVSTKRCEGELLTAGQEVSGKADWFAFEEIDSDEDYFLCGELPVILGMEWGRGWVTLIASHELLQNARLAEADHASLVMDTLMVDDAHVELLGPWTGRGATSPLQSMIKGQFAWWVLHVLLFFVVAAWGLGRRFGRPSDPPRTHRRAFREHALALAAQYQRVGAHGFALHRFAEWSSEQLRRSGASGMKLRKQLEREFSTALSPAHDPHSSQGARNSSSSVQFSVYRKLRDVSGRRLASSSSRKKKG